MLKKTLPLLALAGILLVGCTNNEEIPKKNDTPMEKVRDDAREIKDDVENDVEGHDFNDDKEVIEEIRKGDSDYDPEIHEERNID
ncbi:hypothetical protein [Sporosarcina sp. G11-34]|uniref:hypothetical protein n=1 Tax=Sporosarcina sp. G11-34 TaxID=2849605 RepID=UPI0022A99A05|nr:hypothetical protein [Sporosarcina sp. G11-34]MCZ2260724.1 hypothetical protein [Sporosarcina sp. G11-34]